MSCDCESFHGSTQGSARGGIVRGRNFNCPFQEFPSRMCPWKFPEPSTFPPALPHTRGQALALSSPHVPMKCPHLAIQLNILHLSFHL